MGSFSYTIGAMRAEAKAYRQRGKDYEAGQIEARANQLEAQDREAELRAQQKHLEQQMRDQRDHDLKLHRERQGQERRQHEEMLEALQRDREVSVPYPSAFDDDDWDDLDEEEFQPPIFEAPPVSRGRRARPNRERARLRKAMGKVQYYRPAFDLYLADSPLKSADWEGDPEYQKLRDTPPGNEEQIKKYSLAFMPLAVIGAVFKSAPTAFTGTILLAAGILCVVWYRAHLIQTRKARALLNLARKDIESRNAQRSAQSHTS